MIRFSIVIPCYNQGPFLGEALASVRAQTRPADEIIVVDDGSTDPFTVARIDELSSDGVVLVRQENRGLPGARNAGVRRATGDVIVPLDADDQLTPDALYAYEQAILADPRVDIWYPDTEFFGLESRVYPQPRFSPWLELQRNLMVCSSAIKRRVFDGGVFYNESMRGGYEDWEFFIHACCEREFVARALERPVFRYRRWGFSMLAASDQIAGQLKAQIRRERPIYRDDSRLDALKQASCPFFAVAARTPSLTAPLANQTLRDVRVVDEQDGVLASGELSLFRERPGRALLISLDDAALSRALANDRFLVEKLARMIEAQSPVLTWVMLARDGDRAWPGRLVEASTDGRAIAVVLSLEHFFRHPELPHRHQTLIEDLLRFVEDTAPMQVRTFVAGALARDDEGVARPTPRVMPPSPHEADSPTVTTPPPLVGAGQRLSQAARVLIGPERHDRLWQNPLLVKLRNRLEPTRPAPLPPVGVPLRPGPLSSPLDARTRDDRYAVAVEPARWPAPATRAEQRVCLAMPSIGEADHALVELLRGLDGLELHLVLTRSLPMARARAVLPLVDGVFPLVDEAPADPAGALPGLVERLGAATLLVAHSQVAYQALPSLRQKVRALRVMSLLLSSPAFDEPAFVASRYNNLVDAYATPSTAIAERLTRELYVSPTKVQLVSDGGALGQLLRR